MTRFTIEKRQTFTFFAYLYVQMLIFLFFNRFYPITASFTLSVLVRNQIAAALSLSSTMLHGLSLRNAIHFLSLYSPHSNS